MNGREGEGARPVPAERPWQPKASPWLIAASVMLPTFMEILDTTIAAVSLPHMAGSLAASAEESTWILTSYLISNAIVLPASGWLAVYFGRKRFLIVCLAIFTLSSFLCGAALNLGLIIVARVLQGAGGGALQPLSQAILLESFPPAKRGVAMATYGLGIIFAPIIGPTLGGWITDTYSWRWIFYMNLPVGALAVLMIQAFVEDPPWIRNARPSRIDAIGFGLMAIWLGTLQVILDKGQQEDWFEADWIRWMATISAVAMAAFVIQELRVREPIVNLRIFANRNFALGTALITIVGALIYSTVTLWPIFLQSLMGYTAMLSGMALSPRGIGALLFTPVIGRLTDRIDNRYLIAAGFGVFGLTTFMLSHINLEIAMRTIVWPNFLQGIGASLLFIPLTTLAMGTLRNEQIGNATGLFNLMRNLGGSIGISAVTTLLARDAQTHQALLVEHLTLYDPEFHEKLASLERALEPKIGSFQAHQQALDTIYRMLLEQATLLAFVDNFRWLAAMCLLCIPVVLLFKKVKARLPMAAH